jgi:FkbM family methyltransferase
MLLETLKCQLLRTLRQLRRNHLANSKTSYAQCGEDLILQQLFSALGIRTVIYLDVGAHHPTYLSNTYLFYESGGHGVCVEPDPVLFKEFAKKRPNDINVNCGVGTAQGLAEFFVMSENTLNTFSKAEAERYESYGKHRIEEVISVELRTIGDIVETHFVKRPNLVSLDVEGMDYQILQSLDFRTFRPEVLCLETLTYTENKTERKLTEIISLMQANGYIVYADTYINTIFVDAAAWGGRPS